MDKHKRFFYNFVICPIITILDIKSNFIYRHCSDQSVLDRCNTNIVRDFYIRGKAPTELMIEKGWILTNNKNNYSIVYDSFVTNSSVLLKFRDILNLLFYGVVMYISGRIILFYKSIDLNLHQNTIDRILLYYPQNFDILKQIYTKSPSIPVQIMITSNKDFDRLSSAIPITVFSKPIIPANYKCFDDFISVIIKSWAETSTQSYLSEKRFIDSICHN